MIRYTVTTIRREDGRILIQDEHEFADFAYTDAKNYAVGLFIREQGNVSVYLHDNHAEGDNTIIRSWTAKSEW